MTPIEKYLHWNRNVITIGNRYNNPFNIRWSIANLWQGQIKERQGFVEFSSVEFGLRAGIILLRNYIRKGINTPRAIIYRFAPPSENDTESYLFFISGGLDLDDTLTFGSNEFIKLLCLIANYESEVTLTSEVLFYIINKFQISK